MPKVVVDCGVAEVEPAVPTAVVVGAGGYWLVAPVRSLAQALSFRSSSHRWSKCVNKKKLTEAIFFAITFYDIEPFYRLPVIFAVICSVASPNVRNANTVVALEITSLTFFGNKQIKNWLMNFSL